MEYAELHVRLYKKLKRWVIFLCHVLFVHLWGQKPICPNRADYGHAIQYDKGSFLKNKFLSFEEWVYRSRHIRPCENFGLYLVSESHKRSILIRYLTKKFLWWNRIDENKHKSFKGMPLHCCLDDPETE